MIRNIKLTLFIFLIPFAIDVMIACKPRHATEGGLYRNKSFSLTNLDNSGNAAFITTSDTVPKQAYGIRLHLVRDKVVKISNNHFFFVQNAFADYPANYYNGYVPLDSIVSIQILTKNSFDNNHAANSEITDLFRVYQNYTFSELKHYFAKASVQYSHLSELQIDIDLLLMSVPSTLYNTGHQFKIRLKLSDGRILEQETTMIHLI